MHSCGTSKMSIRVKPLTKHFILIDYENLNKRGYGATIVEDVSHIVKRLDDCSDFFADSKSLESVNVVLYGGWYEDSVLTKLAQRIKQELSSFPFPYTTNANIKVEIICNLALSLKSRPDKPLYGTVVERDLKQDITIPRLSCCEETQEHFEYLETVFRTGECPQCKSRLLGGCFKKPTQKLVDAMLFCDGLQLVREDSSNRVAIVSSDTDMVPVLVFLSDQANGIYHVGTVAEGKGRRFSKYYNPLMGSKYHGIEW